MLEKLRFTPRVEPVLSRVSTREDHALASSWSAYISNGISARSLTRESFERIWRQYYVTNPSVTGVAASSVPF